MSHNKEFLDNFGKDKNIKFWNNPYCKNSGRVQNVKTQERSRT